jgi:hypothetical protein
MNEQMFTVEIRRPITIRMSRRKISAALLSSLPFIDTDLDPLRGDLLWIISFIVVRRGSNKNPADPQRPVAFPWTFNGLQLLDRNLREKWTSQKSSTESHNKN